MTVYLCRFCGERSLPIDNPHSEEQKLWDEHDCGDTHRRCAMHRPVRCRCEFRAGTEGCYVGNGVPTCPDAS